MKATLPAGLNSARMRREALMRLLPLVAMTLLVIFALFCAWQAWLIADQRAVSRRVQKAQDTAIATVTGLLKTDFERINQVLSDPQVAQALESDDVAGRAAAAALAYKRLPEARNVEFFSPTLSSVVKADYRVFGYSKAAQLMAVQSDDAQPRLESISRKGDRTLSFARPVTSAAGKVLAYAWVELPFKPLKQGFEALDPDNGRLELLQGDGSDDDLVLLSNGTHRAVIPYGNTGVPLRFSAFRIAAALPQAWIVLPRSLWVALLLCALGLAGAGGLLWLRMRPAPADGSAEAAGSADTEAKAAEAEKPQGPGAAAVVARPGAARDAAPRTPPKIDRSIFRAYDIRGVVGSQLTADVATCLGQAIGGLMREKGLKEIVIGRDGRLSGPELSKALAGGLRKAGMDVIDIGAVPTPLVYFATYHYNTGSGVAVTGSHNPPDYNGFKIVVGGQTLSEAAIQDLCRRIVEGPLPCDGNGALRQMDIVADYVERIASDVQVERPLKVVVDAGNGIAGAVGPQLLSAIGCTVEPLYCDVDGQFPNHHPDPSDPENLEDLIVAVEKTAADLGVAFDGDGDRLGVVTREGKIINPDRLLMLFARDVLARDPGATIIYDVKCSGHLGPDILRHGGSPLMWRTGHSLIKSKMRETDAALAGEMSGHFFFRERWYGFDDGIYSAARLLEILAGDHEGRDADAIFATLPESVSTPELKIPMTEGANHTFIERFREKASFDGARLTTIDGVRADWPDGWGLVRASNTTPVLVLRFEADNAEALARIQDQFAKQLLAVNPTLRAPFLKTGSAVGSGGGAS